MIVFFNHERSVLISTNHILPDITPNIAYWFHSNKNPLNAYIESLEKLRKLDVGYVIPSHGDPFYNANKRIDELLKHHNDRLERTLKEVENGSTVYSICNKLFNKEMDFHEKRFALGETLAHLEYLRYQGYLTREINSGEWIYFN